MSWEEFEKSRFSKEDIAISDFKVSLIGALKKAREEKGLTQKDLEEMSGVKQPIIARLEHGTTNPQIDTLIKVLVSLGFTLDLKKI